MRVLFFGCLAFGFLIVGCSSHKQEMPRQSGFIVQPGGPGGPQVMSPQSMPQGQGQQGIFAQPQPPTILVQGNVKNHILGWTEDLTLAQALVNAEYQGMTTPRAIVLVRQGLATEIDMKKFLRGRENPILQPGDIIDLRF